MNDNRKPTAELAKVARELANELFKGPCERVKGMSELRPASSYACLSVAEEKGRNKKTGERTPFFDYDPKKMCLPCSAYWHAERAAQLLEHRLADEYAERAASVPTCVGCGKSYPKGAPYCPTCLPDGPKSIFDDSYTPVKET